MAVMTTDVTDTASKCHDVVTSRPAHHLTYREASDATGLSVRHLRRLVSSGAIEATDAGGRRWVATSSLLAAGYRLDAPDGNGPSVGSLGTPPPDLSEELATLRRRLAVAEALAAERAREVERLGELVHRTLALLPGAGGTSPPDTTGDRPRRWWRRRAAAVGPG